MEAVETIRFADRMFRLGTESAFEVLARAKALEAEGRDIVHLEIGEPDFPTPAHIVEAAKKAWDDGYTHYLPAAGAPALRRAIADYVGRTRAIDVDPAEVVVTPGAKPILFFTFLALLNEGDEVIYPDPGFPIYESLVDFIGARRVPIPLRMERGFSFDVEEFESLLSDRTRLVVLNSPHNPTGGVIPEADLRRVAEILRDRDVMILSDEIYSEILYEGKHVSITRFPGMQEKTILLDGFSKTFAMTGWRLGYGIMPRPLADRVTQLHINSNSCTSSFTQVAGVAALTGPFDAVREMVRRFQRRRDVLVNGLSRIPGIECVRPAGAFYVFPRISGTGLTSRELQRRLLDEVGVAALSGTAFGDRGEGFLRFSSANSTANIREALSRLRGLLA